MSCDVTEGCQKAGSCLSTGWLIKWVLPACMSLAHNMCLTWVADRQNHFRSITFWFYFQYFALVHQIHHLINHPVMIDLSTLLWTCSEVLLWSTWTPLCSSCWGSQQVVNVVVTKMLFTSCGLLGDSFTLVSPNLKLLHFTTGPSHGMKLTIQGCITSTFFLIYTWLLQARSVVVVCIVRVGGLFGFPFYATFHLKQVN